MIKSVKRRLKSSFAFGLSSVVRFTDSLNPRPWHPPMNRWAIAIRRLRRLLQQSHPATASSLLLQRPRTFCEFPSPIGNWQSAMTLFRPFAGNLRFDLYRHIVQVFFAGGAHRAFDFRGHCFSLVLIDFDNDFVVDDVHDFA